MMSSDEAAITVPDLGSGDLPIHVSTWLAEVGEYVFPGDRIVELSVPGVTFDVASPGEGRLVRIERYSGALVIPGQCLGVLQPFAEPA